MTLTATGKLAHRTPSAAVSAPGPDRAARVRDPDRTRAHAARSLARCRGVPAGRCGALEYYLFG